MVKLSIVIPYYKTYELTDKLLETLVPQLTEETEVILIDDGCHETRLDKYKDKIYIEHLKENIGGASASNIGIKKAKGEYIGFIDSDDMIDKHYIEELIRAIDEQGKDAIFMDWQDMANGRIIHHPYNYASWKAIYKREIVPMYDEGWIYSYDVPFWEKLNKKPYTRYDIGKVLYYYNSKREGNLTSEKEKIRRNSMIKCEVIENFTLKDFDKLIELKRGTNKNKNGELYVTDTFKCDKEMAEYLTGKNALEKTVVKILEVEPVKEESKEITEEKQVSTKVSSKKKKS